MPSKKQQKGYRSNGKVREWLLTHGFTFIYFHPHPPQYRLDKITVSKDRTFYAKDLFGLFDGMALDSKNEVVFFQVKTNSWDGMKEIAEWVKGRRIKAILFNVRDRIGVELKFFGYS